jgi:carbonic anhydrase/acetyltransferase-like protein (isoleucine patch superfamily)
MIVRRNQAEPVVAPSARVAPTAQLVGDVRVGEGCVIDYGAVVASAGPPVVLGRGVVVMPNAVVRSVGGEHRPAYPVEIGDDSLIGPLAALAGCVLGEACYVATGVMVFHGARVGTGSRLGAGSIVHTAAVLPPASRVGMRQFAVAGADGTVVTSDLDTARTLLAKAGFFERAFASDEADPVALHREATATLRAEADGWDDLAPAPR